MIATNAFKQAVVGTYTTSDTVIELDSISDTVGNADYLRDGGFNLILYDGLFGNPADANNAGSYEILQCTGVNYATNEITVTRAQEDTTAVTIGAGSWQVVYGATKAFFDQFEGADATILKEADIVNDLTTGGVEAPLSAEQGKELNNAKANLAGGNSFTGDQTVTGDLLFSGANRSIGTSTAHDLIFKTNNTERGRIKSGGLTEFTGVATVQGSLNAGLHIRGNSVDGSRLAITGGGDGGSEVFLTYREGSFGDYGAGIRSFFNGSDARRSRLELFTSAVGDKNITRMSISHNGAVNIIGALSKGSGSFKIKHPHPSKKDTHNLVHSFMESPMADLVYSGMVKLENGKAEINIDTESSMTEGTFVLLCRNVRVFCSNEEGFTAVKSSINGNLLTIEAENSNCSDKVFWQVIGERQDEHMYATEWTDENGRVIVEPELITN